MIMTILAVECLTSDKENEIMELSQIYLEAFDDNGAYRYVFPKTLPFANEGLRWLFERRTRMLLACGAEYRICKDTATGKVIGGVGCLRSAQKPSFFTMMWHGMLLWPFLWGFDTMSRALEIDNFKSSKEEEGGEEGGGGRLADPKSWDAQLAMMAVQPTHQGAGVGKMLLQSLLQEMDKDETCRTIGLNTQKETNLRFYSQHGFDQVDHVELHGFGHWTLVRVKPQ